LTSATEPIVIDLAVDDADIADRLAAMLAEVPGVRLAAPGEPADVRLVAAEMSAASVESAGLTPRELEVLSLLAEGVSNKAIARRLNISVHTAKFHVGSVIDKLDAIGRTDAVAHAARRGLIEL
jgi:DNA-binding CsgD family transcriptional regulator